MARFMRIQPALVYTAAGQYAMYSNTTGFNNMAIGQESLISNTTGSENTASGQGALYSNTDGRWQHGDRCSSIEPKHDRKL